MISMPLVRSPVQVSVWPHYGISSWPHYGATTTYQVPSHLFYYHTCWRAAYVPLLGWVFHRVLAINSTYQR